MATKRSKGLKDLAGNELSVKLRELEAQLFDVKMKVATGTLTDTAMGWRLRKDVARLKTMQTAQAAAVKASAEPR